MKVLVAEDTRLMRRTLQRHLQSWGHSVTLAEDGQQAWDLYQSEDFDAVLTDWQMPGLSGIDLVRRIREGSPDRYVYTILLTSHTSAEDLVEGLDAGADDYLRKPFERDELRARLNAGARIIRLERELAERTLLMSQDLDVAAEYVRSLIPLPRSSPEKIHWRHVPAENLAGDSLGFHDLDNEHVALYLLDVTGHGVAAALMSVMVLNVVRSMTMGSVDYRRPAEVLARLNDVFPMSEHEDRFFSMWYGVFNRTTRCLRWAGGGHPPALLLAAGQTDSPGVTQLSSKGPLVGMLPGVEFPAGECEVPANAVLYVYSDGVYEFDQADGTEWGVEGLSEYLSGRAMQTDDVLDPLFSYVQNASGNPKLDDDFTILEARL